MNSSHDDVPDDALARRLAEYDDALLRGDSADEMAEMANESEESAAFKEGQAFLRLLNEVWPRDAADTPLPASLHTIPHTIGRFEVRRILGHGGAGIVYLAHDPLLGREVAVKVPRLEVILSASHRQRFVREARLAALLNHPNIVPTLEVSDADHLCFIVYVYCAGATLAEWLARYAKPLPCIPAARLIEQLADAMAHAHQRGIVHRDLKPRNVMLERTASDGEFAGLAMPKITDFGLARCASDSQELTHTGTALGTPPYMSPEQTRGDKDIGPATDIWALGVLLYELLTGQLPFRGTPDETYRQILDEEPMRPRSLRPDIPRDLENICLKCLAKEPSRRYESAFALAADLRRYQNGEPVHVRPVPAWERLWKWSRRRPTTAALVGVILVALVTGAIGTASYLRRLEDLVAANLRERDLKKKQDEMRQQAKDEESARFHRHQYVTAIREVSQDVNSMAPQFVEKSLSRWSNPAEVDERGLEWYQLRRMVQPRSAQCLFAAKPREFSVNGRYYSLSRDTKFAFMMRTGGDIEIFETATWNQVAVLPGSVANYFALRASALAPDNKLLAIQCNEPQPDGTIKPRVQLWDWRKKELRGTAELPKEIVHAGVEFTPANDALQVRVNGELHFYSVARFPEKIGSYRHDDESIANDIFYSIFSPDGKRLVVTRSNAKRLEICDFPSLKRRHVQEWAQLNGSFQWRFSDDSKLLLYGTIHAIDLIEVDDPKAPRRMANEGDHLLYGVEFSRDNSMIFVGSNKGFVDAFGVKRGNHIYRSVSLDKWIIQMTMAADGRRLLVRTTEGSIYALNITWPLHPDRIECMTGRVYALAYSPDSKLLASGGRDEGLRIWDAASRKLVQTLACSDIFSLAFSPDGKTLAAGDNDGMIHRWDVQTWKPIDACARHEDRVAGLTFSPDSQQLLSMSWDYSCNLWDLKNRKAIRTFVGPFKDFPAFAFSPSRSEFVLGGTIREGQSSTIRYNLADGKERDLGFALRPRSICYSLDDRWMALGTATGQICIWDFEKEKMSFPLLGHTRGIPALAFSRDGKTLASAGLDGFVKIWDRAGMVEMLTLSGPTDEIRALVWSPDGKSLAAAGHDDTIWIWDAK